MTTKPILFLTMMRQAIRYGCKTQTRRVIKNPDDSVTTMIEDGNAKECDQYGDWHARACPYGKTGDRLWVQEEYVETPRGYLYRDDAVRDDSGERSGWWIGRNFYDELPWQTAQCMPERAARLWLEILTVRVERVQQITETDAINEGCINAYGPDFHVGEFRKLWDALYAKRGDGWDANPWVWVIRFRPVPRPS